jgi:pimeloyl-ACP methyl ester carboxylesterase
MNGASLRPSPTVLPRGVTASTTRRRPCARRAASAAGAAPAAAGELSSYEWNGFECAYRSAGVDGPPIVLIHGFGVSSFQYRDTIEALSKTNRVYALDLVGFGASDQPDVEYCMEFWRDQVIDFVERVVGEPAVLCGNSIGSLAAIHVASENQACARGVVLLNCAGGMNNKVKRMPGDFDGFGWQYKAVVPVFNVVLAIIDFVLKIEPVAKPLFDNVRTEENVRGALQGVYKDPARVDDALVRSIVDAAERDGAFRAFVRILTGNPGPRPEEMMDRVTCPMLILWGDEDGITPMDFPLGQYFVKLPESRADTTLRVFEGAGHCLQDDDPDAVSPVIRDWVGQLR